MPRSEIVLKFDKILDLLTTSILRYFSISAILSEEISSLKFHNQAVCYEKPSKIGHTHPYLFSEKIRRSLISRRLKFSQPGEKFVI